MRNLIIHLKKPILLVTPTQNQCVNAIGDRLLFYAHRLVDGGNFSLSAMAPETLGAEEELARPTGLEPGGPFS